MSGESAAEIRSDAKRLVATDERFADVDPTDLPIEVWGPGFGSMIHLILGQQVSIEAAGAMFAKLVGVLGEVTPDGILGLDQATLQACGFTRLKAQYARGLAEAELAGLSIDQLSERSDAEVVAQLVELRGVGRWTAECYLLFCLGRRDVFPAGDMALQVGFQELIGLDQPPSATQLADSARVWAPRRTAAAYLLWHRYLDARGRA